MLSDVLSGIPGAGSGPRGLPRLASVGYVPSGMLGDMQSGSHGAGSGPRGQVA